MQIHSSQDKNICNPIAFGAIKVATAKNFVRGKETIIDIYRLTRKDKEVIDYLEKSTHYEELVPQVEEIMQERWQKVFQYCIEEIKEGNNQNFVAIAESRPCGLLTYYANEALAYLDGVCKIPKKKSDNVRLIGQSLILKFLKSASKEKSQKISLDAVKDGPIDVISIYEKLGFKKIYRICNNEYQPMEMSKYQLKESINKLEKLIDYTESQSLEEVNLFDIIG